MENFVKSKIKNGDAALGIRIVESKTLGVLKILADSGIDWVFIDCEHGSYDMETVLNLARYSNSIGLCPVIKAPQLNYQLISRPLDQGAMGVIIPLIESAEQARDAVRFVRYPPTGERGCGLDNDYSGWKSGAREYLEWANENILLILQIESRTAIENIDEIAKVKGVDVLFMGPLDLSISLGVPGEVNHPLIVESIEKVAEACKQNGVVFGFPGSVENAAKWFKCGARFLCLGSDTTILAEGCREKIKSFRRSRGYGIGRQSSNSNRSR
ncbi:MAG: aldolase/citrate lyase family protein [Clostridiales bacterium]|nr:aldolase/citrate lyase family protein [Clostridiales bacterium]